MERTGRSGRRVGLGVCGLGRAFTLMLPTLRGDARFALVGAAEPDAAAREAFTREFPAPAHAELAALLNDPQVEAVYVASPHGLHAEHAIAAARAARHVLVEKPMATTLADARAMVDAATAAGVHLVVGPSHSFDAPVLRARALIASGEVGAVRMIHALNYTDFLYRPRRPEELDTARGGGVVFSQGAHQVDVARLLGGGRVRSVRAHTGRWDAGRPTEGAYTAMLEFVDGAVASLTYSGYAHFDSDALLDWRGELGRRKNPDAYASARRALAAAASPQAEAALKRARNYGQAGDDAPAKPPDAHEHFGLLLVSCERADLWPRPDGVMVYGDADRRLEPLPPPTLPRREVMDELHAAVVHDRPPLHSGAWGLATLEVCVGILRSAEAGREIAMAHQVPVP